VRRFVVVVTSKMRYIDAWAHGRAPFISLIGQGKFMASQSLGLDAESPLGRFSLSRGAHCALFLFPIAVLGALLLCRALASGWYGRIIKEDGPLEFAQWFFYISAAGCALAAGWVAMKLRQRFLSVLYLLLGVGLFFVAREEISWGQRIFEIETPASLRERNTQRELTIHNIDSVQTMLHEAYMIVGVGAGLAWLVIPRRMYPKVGAWFAYVIPPWVHTFYFLPVGLFYLYMGLTRGHLRYRVLQLPDQELFERLLSMGFLVFTWHNLRRLREATRRTPAPPQASMGAAVGA
jgi:hypothetical protein